MSITETFSLYLKETDGNPVAASILTLASQVAELNGQMGENSLAQFELGGEMRESLNNLAAKTGELGERVDNLADKTMTTARIIERTR